ncbi:MAG: hypothetical protein OXU79_19500 [Gemmatimonadota bacterium]|nr:hypothetical protein [Gemmatimonadota bacterium]
MSFELVVILFIVLSVISSLINKVLEGRRRRELEEEDLDMPPLGIPDVDPTEDDMFPEPAPTVPAPKAGEFQEVRGTRRVSEAPTGPEFQEIRGARPVSEPQGGREFREVRGARPVSETYTGDEYRPAGFEPPEDGQPGGETGGVETESAPEGERHGLPDVQPLSVPRRRRTRRRRIQLDFKPKTVRKAIVYNEILGPPVADRRP